MRTLLFFTIAVCTFFKSDGDSLPENSFVKMQQEKIVHRKFDQAKSEQITKGIDYSDERKRDEVSPVKRNWKLFNYRVNPAVAKVIIFTLVICALAFLLFKIFGKNIFKKNPEIKTGNLFSEAVITEETPVDGLEKLLSEAISKKMFRDAIRIYYLIIIRKLSDRKFILWKKHKTNREYLFEMRSHPSFVPFKEATYIFEAAWYRNVKVEDHDFISVQPKFENLVQSVTLKANEQ